MPRPQFSIRTLLWLTLVVAAFLGGIALERERRSRVRIEVQHRTVKLSDEEVMDIYEPVEVK